MHRVMVLAAFPIAMVPGGTQAAHAYWPSPSFTEKLEQRQCPDPVKPDPNDPEITDTQAHGRAVLRHLARARRIRRGKAAGQRMTGLRGMRLPNIRAATTGGC
jgi:hypothetical protein